MDMYKREQRSRALINRRHELNTNDLINTTSTTAASVPKKGVAKSVAASTSVGGKLSSGVASSVSSELNNSKNNSDIVSSFVMHGARRQKWKVKANMRFRKVRSTVSLLFLILTQIVLHCIFRLCKSWEESFKMIKELKF
jgi:hypothetical protein